MMKKTKVSAVPDPPLQPLRIPTGWRVGWNAFFDVEPIFRSRDDNSWNFGEDMLLLEQVRNGVAIDLGWLPGHRSTGHFILTAVRLRPDKDDGIVGDWDRPLRRLRTRSKRKVVKTLEEWLKWYSENAPSPHTAEGT